MRARSQLLALFLATALVCLAPHRSPAQAQQDQEPPNIVLAQTSGKHPAILEEDSRGPLTNNPIMTTDKQRKALLKSNLAKSSRDATELATLARELLDELNKPKVNSLSPDDIARLERIEKLAKKIREELKGY